jgi:ABC-type antimicrobial peptide transport system permease subunit
MEVHLGTSSPSADNILRTELRALNPHVALADVRTLADQLSHMRSVPRTSAILSSAGAALAVFLALVGVYGVLMTSVDLRRRELAIRAALGATPGGLVRNVMREGLGMALIGVTIGTLVSFQAGQLISHQLFGVAARDTLVMVGAPIVVLIASLVAAYAPSRTAGRVDPVTVLRSQ